MKNEMIVLKKMEENNGTITNSEARQIGIPRYVLIRMAKKGLIERVTHGLYILPSTWGDEYYNLIFSSKNVVFSHATALYLHNLSERVPLIYEITALKGYNASLKNKDISCIRSGYIPPRPAAGSPWPAALPLRRLFRPFPQDR